MATWTMPGWTSEVNDECALVANQVADQNSCPTCDFSVSVKMARTNHAGSDRLPFLGELTSEKSYPSLDEDSILDAEPDNSYTPGALIPGISEVDLPKQTITADPLDLSLTDGDEPEPMQLSKPLETIPEDPDLEAQSAEHDKERDPEELSTHMEDEPAPLVFASLPFQDRELPVEPTLEASEPRLQPLTQTVSESAVRAATSDTSVKADKSTSTVDMVIVDEPPKSDLPPVEGKSSGVVIPFGFQRVGARSKTTEARMSSPERGRRVTKFLEKFHMAEGGGQDRKALAQDTMLSFPLPEDIMSLEGVTKSGDKWKRYAARSGPIAAGRRRQQRPRVTSGDRPPPFMRPELALRSPMATGQTIVMLLLASLPLLLAFLTLAEAAQNPPGSLSKFEFKHHDNRELELELRKIVMACPDVANMYELRERSVLGQPLWVIEITDNPGVHEE
ncbi:carboxypeptidase, putative, partial [Ixodes scapularis]